MSNYKILVGCPAVPHKTFLTLNLFSRSILEQTIKDFDFVMIWGDRERATVEEEEEKLRLFDIHKKMERLWNIFQTGGYDFLWNVATDTWYPPNTLEDLIKFYEKNDGRYAMISHPCWVNWVRRGYKGACILNGWTLRGWASFLFDSYARDNIVPTYKERDETTKGFIGSKGFRNQLGRKRHKNVTIEPAPWSLFYKDDISVSQPHEISELPDFLKERFKY